MNDNIDYALQLAKAAQQPRQPQMGPREAIEHVMSQIDPSDPRRHDVRHMLTSYASDPSFRRTMEHVKGRLKRALGGQVEWDRMPLHHRALAMTDYIAKRGQFRNRASFHDPRA